MSGVKFYVLGGGRWREVDMSSGLVEGWGPARFLVARGGRLRAQRRAPVLRGLRALAVGRPTTVHDGPMLSQIRYDTVSKPKPRPARRQLCDPCHVPCHALCRPQHYGCGHNPVYNEQAFALPAAGPRVSHASVQADLTPDSQSNQDGRHKTEEATRSDKADTSHGAKNTEIKITHRTRHDRRQTRARSDRKTCHSEEEPESKRKRREGGGGGVCKELIITEEDVLLLRDFLVKDDKNVFQVDLESFDADDAYKRRVFYRLNPLVSMERCALTDTRRGERASPSTVTLKDFMSNLGLKEVESEQHTSSSYRTRRRTRGGGDDKENRDKDIRTKTRDGAAGVLRDGSGKTNRGTDSRHDRRQAAEHGNKRACREYSAAEDAAIVRLVCDGARGARVNGNTLWRELQHDHLRLTGHARSWHSLRNRYLRYVLPSLSSLVSPSVASRLRAAAAAGEIKRGSRARPADSSFHRVPAVTSAWSRRRRSPPRESPPPLPPPHTTSDSSSSSSLLNTSRTSGRNKTEGTVVLRSRAVPRVSRTPTYDELTRRFNERHAPDSDSSVTERRASRRLRADRAAAPHKAHARRLYSHAQ
ncbi:uncharacterized protein LOC116776769 isoform X2 [Danaus plexippus]|uniref:uncharacterized protein LOC116776769 isoform X2 n=1 Tax=Danaus plexippus TaxID=13037 RepID=UPI002AB1E890|nr:uncharacterized protein LOC116776769 isoform X2 [Danaus plexippus]